MIILDGKKIADKILEGLKKEVKKLPPIRLVVILVGDNPASLGFIKQKQKAAEKIGVEFKLCKFDLKINNQNLIQEINKIVKDRTATGIVVQLSLPFHINTQKILSLIPAKKDPDALSVDNSFIESPTASGIMKLLEEYGTAVKRKKVVIIGKGRLVGKPLAMMMKKAGADLIICDRQTKDLKSKTLKADILVSATGSPNLIKEDMIKRGTVVIDAGFTKINSKIVGDVDFKNVKKKAGYITPVPGGVGPMTVAMLMNNLIKLANL